MFNLSEQSVVLVVVDMQRQLLATIPDAEEAVNNTVKLVESFHIFERPVVYTEQYRRLMGSTVNPLKNTLAPAEPITKMSFNCCLEPSFMSAMLNDDADIVILCGVETHICVQQTALSLTQMASKVFVAADACSARKKLDHEFALEMMREMGVHITTVEAIIFQILQTAQAQSYKKILKLIK